MSASRKKPSPDEFILTDIGEGIVEVEVLQWFVKPGDVVKPFDKLLEVQSDKATVEITSKHAGTIKALAVPAKGMAKVGQVLVYFESSQGGGSKTAAPLPPPPSASIVENHHPQQEEDKVLSTPAVRHLAREHGIDLARIKGTGKDSRVMKSDVLAFLNPPQQQQMSAAASPAAVEQMVTSATTPVSSTEPIPITGIRREMFKAMTASLTIPHMTLMEDVDVTELHRLLQSLAPSTTNAAPKINMLSVLIKCTSLALLDFPLLNSSLLPETTTPTQPQQRFIQPHTEHNIGIAMDTPSGLLVPVLVSVQNKSIADVARELDRIKLSQGRSSSEVAQPTFSLSNVGAVGGGTYATPLIVPPQLGIGAFGRAKRVPVFVDKESLAVREARVMQVSWSADHRVLDGATLARFSNRFKQLVENPMAQLLTRLR